MKTKLRILSAFVGAAGVAAIITLVVLGIIPKVSLWVEYCYGIAILMILIPLALRARKEDEYSDALKNVAQAKRALSKIKPDKKIGVLKLRSARNQLAETSIAFREIVTEKELYELQILLDRLDEAMTHYKDDENFQAVLTQETLVSDRALLDEIEASLNDLRKLRK